MALVLVAYASRYGSTKEVAESVANTLRESGVQTELQPIKKIKTLDGFDAVVLGAPLYIGKILKDARRFLEQKQIALAAKPVALFLLGPINPEEVGKPEINSQLAKELANFAWLKPMATAIFGGKYDPTKLRFPDSLLAILPASPLYKAPESDARDWKEIKAWAMDLAKKFKGGKK